MRTLAITRRSLRNRGLMRTVRLAAAYCEDYIFDLRYGISTASRQDISTLDVIGNNCAHAQGYQPTHVRAFMALMKVLRIRAGLGFVDFGCGKGRVLLLASRCNFAVIRGVEFSPDLCRLARANVSKYLQSLPSHKAITVIESDVVDYAIAPEEHVFFLFNPFDGLIIKTIVDNVRKSVEAAYRPVYFIYNNPVHDGVVGDADFFTSRNEYRLGDSRFMVYSNIEHA